LGCFWQWQDESPWRGGLVLRFRHGRHFQQQHGQRIAFCPPTPVDAPPGPFSNPLLNLPQYSSVFPAAVPPPKNVVFPLPNAAQTFNPAGGFGPFQVPVIYSWNLTVEHQFAGEWLTRMAYVGSHSSHLSLSEELDPAVYIPNSPLSADQRRIFQPFGSIL
jgi:hypothetical protein